MKTIDELSRYAGIKEIVEMLTAVAAMADMCYSRTNTPYAVDPVTVRSHFSAINQYAQQGIDIRAKADLLFDYVQKMINQENLDLMISTATQTKDVPALLTAFVLKSILLTQTSSAMQCGLFEAMMRICHGEVLPDELVPEHLAIIALAGVIDLDYVEATIQRTYPATPSLH